MVEKNGWKQLLIGESCLCGAETNDIALLCFQKPIQQ